MYVLARYSYLLVEVDLDIAAAAEAEPLVEPVLERLAVQRVRADGGGALAAEEALVGVLEAAVGHIVQVFVNDVLCCKTVLRNGCVSEPAFEKSFVRAHKRAASYSQAAENDAFHRKRYQKNQGHAQVAQLGNGRGYLR